MSISRTNTRTAQASTPTLIAIVTLALVALPAVEKLATATGAAVIGQVDARHSALQKLPAVGESSEAATGTIARVFQAVRKSVGFASERAQRVVRRSAWTNPSLSDAHRFNWERIRPEHLAPAQDVLIKRAEKRIRRIVEAQGPRTYDNTIKALDDAVGDIEETRNAYEALNTVANTPELIAALRQTEGQYQSFFSNYAVRQDVWQVIREYADSADAAQLDPVRRRRLDLLVEERVADGADLPAAEQQRITEIKTRMSELSTQMAKNVNESTGEMLIHITDEARLQGVPDSIKKTLASTADDAGKEGYLINDATAGSVAEFTEDVALRREITEASEAIASVGEYDNTPLMTEMLQLRRELAERTGFRDYADRMTRDRMARDGETAQSFIENILERTDAQRIEEGRAFDEFVKAQTGSTELDRWNVPYYQRLFDEQKSGFNPETVRPYFQLDDVLDEAFSTIEQLFGARIERTHDMPLWHKDARSYRVFREDGSLAGDFYLDVVARPGTKRGGAFQWAIRGPSEDGQAPLAMVVANIRPPAAGQPVLLEPGNIRTIFHELGHLTHSLLSDVEVKPLWGTNVARDFVEFPSQLLQNWAFEPQVLRRIGRHFETGEAIPEALISKIDEARKDGGLAKEVRTASFALLDMKLHREYDPAIHGSLRKYSRDVLQRASYRELPPESTFVNRFGHIQDDGYAAGYYVYQWAGAHEADAFTRFSGDKLLDAAEGRRLLDAIYRRGNSRDPNELYQQFMGRPLDSDAFFRRIGLSTGS